MIRIEIFNDGTGTEKWGNYDAYLYLPNDEGGTSEYHARVEEYPRVLGWRPLVETSVIFLGSPFTREEQT